ncbi:protein SIEVE ELEMENT OCCLUSION B-like [Primulina huaijiensis]|uniref:protein SIEVE ELEMENT OCCLUSION B-like n=1 Tax=Primulina huaijiensis TaxID=1492673 RepID=UPI003CC745A6
MANYQVLPPVTKSRPPITETAVPQKDPVLSGGLVQNFTIDPSLKQSHEQDHGTYNPLPVPRATVSAKGGQTMLKPNPNRLSLSSDESALSKKIVATHSLACEDFDVKPVLAIVEDIFRLAKPLTTTDQSIAPIQGTQVQRHFDTKEDKAYYGSTLDDKMYLSSTLDDKAYDSAYRDLDIVKALAFPINKICSEIVCKCAAGAEAHSVTMDFLRSLSYYPWDAKVVITFAAFAINYGEFWLVLQLQTKDPLAKNIAILKDLPETMQQSPDLRKKFESVFELLSTALKVTHCLIEFKELPTQYISHESAEMAAATAHIPSAAYWIIRSLLACASLLLNLIGSGHEYLTSTAESWEILNMAHKLSVMLEHLQTQLKICKDLIERKRGEDAYIAFKKLMEAVHIDNMKVFKAMFRAKEDQKPLFHGLKKINEKLDILRSKHVLLLITDLDIPHEELNILHSIYNQHPTRQEYEVLWLPIVDSSTSMASLQDTEYRNLQNLMPWHSVEHPSFIEPVAVRYIREVWNFTHRPMLVVLDPQAKLSNLDALPMMWIWGSNGFPFTKQREMTLWAESTWNLELLADAIDPRFTDWIRDNRIICLYGGEDTEWIRRFTQSTRTAAAAMRINLEMLYVGKSNPKEKVRRCHDVIAREKLSHTFPLDSYNDYIWFFWTRLMSMLNSKKRLGSSVDSDTVMQEILNMLTFDGSEVGWAVFSRGNYELMKGNGDILLTVMDNHTQWAYRVDHADKFVGVLDEETRGVRTATEHHCNRLILPGYAGYVSERIVCSECGKTMDQYVMYRCCTD